MNDLLCLSHLRWSSPCERPRQLMSRLGTDRSVFFFEQPMYGGGPDRLEIRSAGNRVVVLVPWLSSARARDAAGTALAQRRLLHSFLSRERIAESVLWYCTPQALSFTAQLPAKLVVYDCMRAPRGASLDAGLRERELLRRADLVFAETPALHAEKRCEHPRVQLCPSGVDLEHFERARRAQQQPQDQVRLARPRVGYAGAIDERVDLALVAALARARPHVQFVMIGPLAVDPARLPRAPNLCWLGKKGYPELPAYMAGWDAAIVPFAPSASDGERGLGKSFEYLAASRRVVTTLPHPELGPFERRGLVRVAHEPESFAGALDAALARGPQDDGAFAALLVNRGWDRSAAQMRSLVDAALLRRTQSQAPRADDDAIERAG